MNDVLSQTDLLTISESQQHTFVLSSDVGTRIYGACVIFYEEIDNDDDCGIYNRYSTIYLPKAICVLSHYPFYNGFCLFLNHVYCISMSPANRIPLEKYISHFFHLVPLPLCGHPGVKYSIGTKQHIFKLNAKYNLKNISFPLKYLFKCLDIDDIITLIGLILLERQIILYSNTYSLITPCAEALRILLWPFEYQYSFIPVLPQSMSHFLEAPVPFIFGIHRSFHDKVFLQNDIVSVDLDNHFITISKHNGQKQRPIKSYHKNDDYYIGKIPRILKNKLKQRLNKHCNVKLFDNNNNNRFHNRYCIIMGYYGEIL